MNKALSKKNVEKLDFLRERTEQNKKLYAKQRNNCVSLLRKPKQEYYSSLEQKNMTDNKKFWKTAKLFLSDRMTSFEKTTLNEN